MSLKEMTVKRLKRYKGKIGVDLAISIVEQECEREAELEMSGEIVTEEEILEKLAELEHEQWSHWTTYFLKNRCIVSNLHRWQIQSKKSYNNLSEEEKESDREWARKVLAVVGAQRAQLKKLIEEFPKKYPDSRVPKVMGYDTNEVDDFKKRLEKMLK